jgi:hypothetical protein
VILRDRTREVEKMLSRGVDELFCLTFHRDWLTSIM